MIKILKHVFQQNLLAFERSFLCIFGVLTPRATYVFFFLALERWLMPIFWVRTLTVAKPSIQTVTVHIRTLKHVTVFWVFQISVHSNAAQECLNRKTKILFSSIFQVIIRTPKILYFSPFERFIFSTIFDFFSYFFPIYYKTFRIHISWCSLDVNLYNFVRSFQRCIFHSIPSYE